MVAEVLEYLSPQSGGRFLDLTLGGGGHAEVILQRVGPEGLVVGVDRDTDVLERTASRLQSLYRNIECIHADFGEIDELKRVLKPICFDGLLLDIGASSMQLDDPERGFSFTRSGPLDMRMDRTRGPTAAELLKQLSARELEEMLRTYGEERHAKRIAAAIVKQRCRRPISDTLDLALLVERASPGRRGRIHPATRTFQALRIAVNDELGALSRLLAGFRSLLEPGGAIVVITFQSLEDRLVKFCFRDAKRACWLDVLTPKPIRATPEEIARNRRSRSAKLRAARVKKADEEDEVRP
jgi:16S rRNA (cytosine1402-N4)-methyltransferase